MKTKFTLGKGLLLLSLALLSYSSLNAENGVLKGTVKDSVTHEVIPFVIVGLEDSVSKQFTTICDQFGNFKFTNLHSGSYILGISILGYKSIAFPVRIDANKLSSDVVILVPRSAVNLSQVTVTGSTKNIGQNLNVINQLDMLLRPLIQPRI